MSKHPADIQASIDHPRDLEEFLALLDRCMVQAVGDPGGYLDNTHLYALQHRIFLRLCHGNIPVGAIDPEVRAEFEQRDEEGT